MGRRRAADCVREQSIGWGVKHELPWLRETLGRDRVGEQHRQVMHPEPDARRRKVDQHRCANKRNATQQTPPCASEHTNTATKAREITQRVREMWNETPATEACGQTERGEPVPGHVC
eukprot:2688822-Rhodomonas_salina.3